MEKHFTLDKTLKGNDHYHAMDPDDAKNILKGIAFIDTLRGSYDLKCLDSEASARSNARRSIVTTCDIKKVQFSRRRCLPTSVPARESHLKR